MNEVNNSTVASLVNTEHPVAMFSAPGHRDTLWSDVKGNVARSRQHRLRGGG
jgi:hypothetical protein